MTRKVLAKAALHTSNVTNSDVNAGAERGGWWSRFLARLGLSRP